MSPDGCPTDGISYAILIDSMLTRWNRDREGQAALLPAVEARFAEAAAGPLGLHTYLHQPQGRMVLDLHGYSTWTAQLAVLATLDDLLHQHRKQGPITDHLSRLDIITGRGNRRCVGRGWVGKGGVVVGGGGGGRPAGGDTCRRLMEGGCC